MVCTDIYAKLKQDHDRHRQLLKRIAEMHDTPDLRRDMLDEFRIEVTAHAAAEEETLYARMLAHPDLREAAQHSVAEHKEIDDRLAELSKQDFGSDAWDEAFRTLRSRYEHHIEEEEEEVFSKAADMFEAKEEQRMAARFIDRKPRELRRAANEP